MTLYVITFEPIKIQKRSAPQNDRLNLSFVKDIYVNAKKMARKFGKMVIYESQILRLTLYLPVTICMYLSTRIALYSFCGNYVFFFESFDPATIQANKLSYLLISFFFVVIFSFIRLKLVLVIRQFLSMGVMMKVQYLMMLHFQYWGS